MKPRRSPTHPVVIRLPAERHARRAAVARLALAPLVRARSRRQAPFLSDTELLARCREHGIPLTLPVPYSQVEAEAVHRGVSLDAVVRAYLLRKLEEVEAR